MDSTTLSSAAASDKMPTTFMDLPRELFLIVCSLLTPQELTRLARVCKDYYLAVQEPLYAHVDINAWDKLHRLVRTLTSNPVVSNISARQRQRWYKLSDAQLRERDIQKLNIALNAVKERKPVSGADFSRCIGAISRRSNGVNIALMLSGQWQKLLTQLDTAALTLPEVRKLSIFFGLRLEPNRHEEMPDSFDVWDICFSGSAFPDLQDLEIDTAYSSPEERPSSLKPDEHPCGPGFQPISSTPLFGLRKMTKIKLENNSMLNMPVLESLFASSIIPQKLTHLEIVNCPRLYQVGDLEALSILLQRSLSLLKHFKLHLNRLGYCHLSEIGAYADKIQEDPSNHLCNIVREMGQNIKSLDLALPFVCSRMLKPLTKKAPVAVATERDYPPIPRDPYSTLPNRLLDAGYRYRRLICWDGMCGAGGDQSDWDLLQDLADHQGENVSWEIVNYRKKCASWHVSGCLPRHYTARDVYRSQEVLETETEDGEGED